MGMLLRRHYEAQSRLERERVARLKREAELEETRRAFAEKQAAVRAKTDAPEAPVVAAEAPVEPVEAPVEPVEAPVEPVEAPQTAESVAPADTSSGTPSRCSQPPAQQSFGSHRHVQVGGKKKHRR